MEHEVGALYLDPAAVQQLKTIYDPFPECCGIGYFLKTDEWTLSKDQRNSGKITALLQQQHAYGFAEACGRMTAKQFHEDFINNHQSGEHDYDKSVNQSGFTASEHCLKII